MIGKMTPGFETTEWVAKISRGAVAYSDRGAIEVLVLGTHSSLGLESLITFGNAVAEDLFDDKRTRATRAFPNELRRSARRKLLYLHEATSLADLRVPPGNRLERLKGDSKARRSQPTYFRSLDVAVNQIWSPNVGRLCRMLPPRS